MVLSLITASVLAVTRARWRVNPSIFFAIGSIVLIQQTLLTYGYNLAPFELAVWAIPTAVAAFLVHGARLMLLDRRLARRAP